jgi:hypothetical protein
MLSVALLLVVVTLGGAVWLAPYWVMRSKAGALACKECEVQLSVRTCNDLGTWQPQFMVIATAPAGAGGRATNVQVFPWLLDNYFFEFDAMVEALRRVGLRKKGRVVATVWPAPWTRRLILVPTFSATALRQLKARTTAFAATGILGVGLVMVEGLTTVSLY